MRYVILTKLTKILLCISLLINLNGCVRLSDTSSLSSLQNNFTGNISARNIKEDLTRYYFNVKAYPITGAFIEADTQEVGRKEGLSQVEIKNKIASYKSVLKNYASFMISFNSHNPDEVNLRYWGIQLWQGEKQYELKFLSPEARGLAITTTTITSHTIRGNVSVSSYNDTSYFNDGLAVTPTLEHTFDFTHDFSLVLTPRFKQNPKPIIFTWKAPRRG